MKVAQLMTRNVVTLRADDDLATATELMGLRRFRHIPVVEREERDQLVGLVSAKDIERVAAGAVGAQREAQLARVQIRDIMQSKVATTTSSADLVKAAAEMSQKKYGCLPVVDEGRLVGILTEADFVRLVMTALQANPRALDA